MGATTSASGFDHSIRIDATPSRVLAAFFDPVALARWWEVVRSVTTPRPLGVYAIEWEPTEHADDVLGRLGGVFYGQVIEYQSGRELFVADAWWLPPDGEPLGPMSLQVTCVVDGPGCRLRVRQAGADDGPRWQRYYALIGGGWVASLALLKAYVEGTFNRRRGEGEDV